jgi:dipeptidyl-peptidase 4
MSRWSSTRSAVFALGLVSGLLVPITTAAQGRALTIDDLYDPDRRIDFSGKAPSGLTWISDTQYVWAKPRESAAGSRQPEGVEWLKVTATTGASEPLFDAERMRKAFDSLPGLRAEDVAGLPARRNLEMNEDRTATIVSIGDDLYFYAFGSDRAVRLTFTPEPEGEFTFSPDGTLVAYVRGHNLFVVDVDQQQRQERQLTEDGSHEILNGKLDWVYQEEIYGRGTYRAYWWSPDSVHLAFLQLNEQPVPEFTIVDHIPTRLGVETWDYPKAGDRNPTVRLGVVSVAGGAVRWTDLDKYSTGEFLIVNVSWKPDGSRVVYQVQNREQTWLDLNVAGPGGRDPQTLFRETTKAWVNDNGAPTWLKDGSFLWLSERTGWKHLYHYKADGTLLAPVTRGEWDLRTLHGLDESAGWIYFSGTERSYVGLDAYRVKVDGSGLKRLTERAGTHRSSFSPGFRQFLDTWSDLNTPPQVRVHTTEGGDVRVVHESTIAELSGLRLAKPQRLQVKTRDGFAMEAILIQPPDMKPGRKYPVMQFTYGGPYAPRVSDAWGGQTFMYYQMLAQRGIAVWICDNRSASGKGVQSAWTSYKNFGELELRDVEDGLAYLKQQPWVDASRIGLDGWSFGGFMVTYALTHSKSFAMGIGGGNVTDWTLYDSIYTERYMLMPQNNPEGYAKSSALRAAKDLHGKLLLIHGVIDDNVHMQNTLKFTYELQKAGKPFRLMVYEKSRHGIADPALVKHMRQMMFDFTVESLLDASPATQTTTSQR